MEEKKINGLWQLLKNTTLPNGQNALEYVEQTLGPVPQYLVDNEKEL
jgi:hypothetical protein